MPLQLLKLQHDHKYILVNPSSSYTNPNISYRTKCTSLHSCNSVGLTMLFYSTYHHIQAVSLSLSVQWLCIDYIHLHSMFPADRPPPSPLPAHFQFISLHLIFIHPHATAFAILSLHHRCRTTFCHLLSKHTHTKPTKQPPLSVLFLLSHIRLRYFSIYSSGFVSSSSSTSSREQRAAFYHHRRRRRLPGQPSTFPFAI